MTLVVDAGLVVLTQEQTAELRAVVNSRDVSAAVATRARIVLWVAEGKRRKDVGELAGVSLPTVDRWVRRCEADGLAGLEELQRDAPREQVHPVAGSAAITASPTSVIVHPTVNRTVRNTLFSWCTCSRNTCSGPVDHDSKMKVTTHRLQARRTARRTFGRAG